MKVFITRNTLDCFRAETTMKTHDPGFGFNAIQLNKNVQTMPHYDKRNIGCSYCLGLGDFTGGGLRVFDEHGRSRDIDNKRKWVLYNGKTTYHASVPVRSGVRFAVIFYMYKLGEQKHLFAGNEITHEGTVRDIVQKNKKTHQEIEGQEDHWEYHEENLNKIPDNCHFLTLFILYPSPYGPNAIEIRYMSTCRGPDTSETLDYLFVLTEPYILHTPGVPRTLMNCSPKVT